MDSTLAIIAELISSTDNSAFFISRRVQIVHETKDKMMLPISRNY